MFISRVSSRLPRSSVVAQCRNSLLLSARQQQQQHLPIISSQFHSLPHPKTQFQVVTGHVSLVHQSLLNSFSIQRFGFSSSANPLQSEKDAAGSTVDNKGAAAEASGDTETSSSNDTGVAGQTKESGSNLEPDINMSQSVRRRRTSTKRTKFSDSDSDSEGDLSMDDWVKLVAEKEELLKMKDKEIEKMQDKVLRTYAEMENVMDRTRREAENSKKFAIQNFAKGLLDVADNLSRASSVVKENFSKIDTSKDTSEAVPLLKTLLEGVEMTDKQLLEVFKKSGVEKYDPTNEQFDPHRHNAIFQVPDASKPPGTVAVVLKPGYTLYDRVLRPAEVGVTDSAAGSEEA